MLHLENYHISGLESTTVSTDQPPSNNMGVEKPIITLPPLENRVLIDWAAFTFKDLFDPYEVISNIGFDKFEFEDVGHGQSGYKSSLKCGNITVLFNGANGMGVHVIMSGQGCRQFDTVFLKANRWVCFLASVVGQGGNFTRVDLAMDNVDGCLDLDKLETAIRSDNIRTRFKSGHKIENFKFGSAGLACGKTINVGSATSAIKIRFYDKAAERGLTDCQWTRAEIQCRKERAAEVVRLLLTGIEVGQLTAEIMNNYFQPINSDDERSARCTVQAWWLSWIGTTSKIRLSTMKAIKYIEEVADQLKRQYSPSLAMLKEYMGCANFTDFIHEMTSLGASRMKQKHRDIMAVSRLFTEPIDDFETGCYYPF